MRSSYDDGNIPEIDLPKKTDASNQFPQEFGTKNAEPLPESERPRKDGPGGE